MFPPTCLGCGKCLRHDRPLALCTRCRPGQARLPPSLACVGSIHAPWDYDGPLARAVIALKFEGRLALAGPLGRLLAEEPRLHRSPDDAPVDLVVPVPLHWRRRMVRGFDQSEALARWALLHLRRRGLGTAAPQLASRLLVRRRHTRPQSELRAGERARNLAGAFALGRGAQVRGRRVVVLDDVTTTGATARACMEVLRQAGATSVHTLALLRSS